MKIKVHCIVGSLALLVSFAFPAGFLFAQTVPVKTYYDDAEKLIKESYHVSSSSQELNGIYTSYYFSGKIKSKGLYQNNQAVGPWEYFYENGNLKMKGELKENSNFGLWEYFYENGNLSMKGNLFDGMRQMEWTFYYESGSVKSQGKFLDNKKVGIWNYFYEDGSLKAQAFYENGKGLYREFYTSGKLKMEGQNVEGKSDSLWIAYYENGRIQSRGYYQEGLKHGLWTYYYPNGNVSAQGFYQEGYTNGEWTYFHKNGTKSSQGVEKGGLKDGYWKLFHENGEFKGEGNFTKGEGKYQEYYENGRLRVNGILRNDKSIGKWYYYYEDGTLEGTCDFVEGVGDYTGYYEDGSLKMEGRIINGQKQGIWKLYDKAGKIVGYYKAILENEKPIFKVVSDTLQVAHHERTDYDKPEFRFKTRRSKYFDPRINEFRSVIGALNVLPMPLGKIPVSFEYYMQERLGYELTFTYIRRPFFVNNANVSLEKPFNRGIGVSLRQKFYQPDEKWGMLYYGHEVSFTSLIHSANIEDDASVIRRIHSNEERLEYLVIAGNRLIKDAGKPGVTFDLFVGAGLGLRLYRPGFSGDPSYERVFANVPKSRITFPIRFGVAIGYAAKASKQP
jgi:uncharacterized protein